MNSLIAEYVWSDLSGNLRSKIRIIQKNNFYSFSKVEDFPIWNFDGSSTGQSSTTISDVIIRPVRLYKNPFSSFLFTIDDSLVIALEIASTTTRPAPK